MKKFEKVEKTGIISTKFLLRCTPSVILGTYLFQIPGADTAAIAAISAAALTNGGRVCGRVLASITAAESDDTIAGVGTVCGK